MTRRVAPGPPLVTAPGAAPEGVPAESGPERVLYLVATVHLDTQWKWTVRETIRELLPDTLERNFALFERFPSYVLSFEGAFRYMLAREYFPEQFERLRHWAAAGRWRPAGSMLDAPDVNLAAPESIVRHVLYANDFFRRELGRESCDLFLPDCFGFGFALPTLAAHCGLKGFSSQKFIKWMAPARSPFDIGLWLGPDGRGVVAALNPGGYGDGIGEDLSRSPRWRERIDRLGEETGLYIGFSYFGVGDRGGAPDDESLRRLEESRRDPGPIRVIPTASDQLFRDLTPAATALLPRHEGELLLPAHGTGGWTVQAAMKRFNRQNEVLAAAAERAAVIADWLGASPYPGDELTDAWVRFLWHQAHDDLCGTAVPAAYRISWNDEAVAANRFAAILTDAVAAIARGLDTSGEGLPLVVFNPLAAAREDVVEARIPWPPGAAGVRVVDPSGREVPAQVEFSAGGGGEGPAAIRARPGAGGSGESGEAVVVFLASPPPLGVAVYRIFPGAAAAPAGELEVAADRLENELYRVELDGDGDIARIRDKRHGRDLLAGPLRLELLRDRSRRWPAWEVLFEDLEAPAAERLRGPAARRVVERGPARVVLEVRRRLGRGVFRQRLRLAAGGAGGRLEIDHQLEWRRVGWILKARFPLAVSNPLATYDLGVGVLARGNNRPEKYEVPAQRWADLTDRDGAYGVAIFSDCKYAWDKPDDRTLRLTLLRSPRAWGRQRYQATQDHGRHRFLIALVGHAGDWRAGEVAAEADRLEQPLVAFRVASHPGPFGRSLSFLEILDAGEREAAAVSVMALKRAERRPELVVRLRETAGRPARARLRFPAAVAEAREVDGSEHPAGAALVEDGELVAGLGAWEPRAWAFALTPPRQPLPPPASSPLALPHDVVAASFHGHSAGGDFDGRGRTLPGEQLPARVRSSGAELHFGPREPGARNALACRGQELPLPEGFDSLHLLAASVRGEVTATLTIDGRPHRLAIGACYGWLGQWDRFPVAGRWGHLGPLRRGFRRRHPVAWMASHRHDARGRDEPYVFCYFFGYRLALPPEARAVRLPDDARLRLLAASVCRGAGEAVPAMDLIAPPGGGD